VPNAAIIEKKYKKDCAQNADIVGLESIHTLWHTSNAVKVHCAKIGL
jgi:hypothetical protein